MNEVSENKSEKIDELTTRSLSHETWSQHLDYLLNEDSIMGFITSQGLHLIDYKLLNYKLDKNIPMNENSYVPLYSDPKYINNFIILPLSEIKRIDSNIGNRYENGLKQILLDDYSHSVLKNVQLTWRYKNEEFTTICFVTDKEVIYDDILSNIRIIEVCEADPVIAVNTPRIKSGRNEDDGDISYHVSTRRLEARGWAWEVLAYAQCDYWFEGIRVNGVNYLERADFASNSWASPGYYYADADTRILSFDPGGEEWSHASFAYGLVVNYWDYVSVSWNDLEGKYQVNSVYPPDDSEINNFTVTPNMLE